MTKRKARAKDGTHNRKRFPAKLPRRIVAVIADLIIMAIPLNIFVWTHHPQLTSGKVSTLQAWWLDLIIPFNEVLIVAVLGATFGKKLVGIRIVDYSTGDRSSISQIVTRFCVKWGVPFVVLSIFAHGAVSNMLSLLGVLTILLVLVSIFTYPERRGFHDQLARTFVCERNASF